MLVHLPRWLPAAPVFSVFRYFASTASGSTQPLSTPFHTLISPAGTQYPPLSLQPHHHFFSQSRNPHRKQLTSYENHIILSVSQTTPVLVNIGTGLRALLIDLHLGKQPSMHTAMSSVHIRDRFAGHCAHQLNLRHRRPRLTAALPPRSTRRPASPVLTLQLEPRVPCYLLTVHEEETVQMWQLTIPTVNATMNSAWGLFKRYSRTQSSILTTTDDRVKFSRPILRSLCRC